MTNPTWGDTVRVVQHAPDQFRPGALAAVCGLRTLESREQSLRFGRPVGAEVCLVEFADGHAIELPADLLAVLK